MKNDGHCGASALAYGTMKIGYGHILLKTNIDEIKTDLWWMVRNIIAKEYTNNNLDGRYSSFFQGHDEEFQEHIDFIRNTNMYLGQTDFIAYSNAVCNWNQN